MKYKILEDNSKRLCIQISYEYEQKFWTSVVVAGIFIIILTYLGIIPSLLASTSNAPKESLLAPCYITGGFIAAYGILNGLIFLSSITSCSFDKSMQKLSIQKKGFFSTTTDEYPLFEVTGVEELSLNSATELVAWLKKGDQFRGSKVTIARASGYGNFHMLWRKVSEFLRDHPTQLLDLEWTIEQSDEIYKVYRSSDMYRNSDTRSYTVNKRKGLLIYKLEGEELGEYDINQIKDIQVENNQDKNDDEMSDRIILEMNSKEKQPISTYCYSSTSGHHPVVRSLKYALGLQPWLHLSPDMQQGFYAP